MKAERPTNFPKAFDYRNDMTEFALNNQFKKNYIPIGGLFVICCDVDCDIERFGDFFNVLDQ